MKILSRRVVAVLTILLFAHGVVSFRIETQNNDGVYCDSLMCPPGATACQVNKRNDPNDFSQVVGDLKCLDAKGGIIAQETTHEPNSSGGRVQISSRSSVRRSSAQE